VFKMSQKRIGTCCKEVNNMCLVEFVPKARKQFKSEQMFYKVFVREGKTLYFEYYSNLHNFVVGEWLHCVENLIEVTSFVTYLSGFHCYETLKQAKQVLAEGLEIWAVQGDGIVKKGRDMHGRVVVVFERIKIIKKI